MDIRTKKYILLSAGFTIFAVLPLLHPYFPNQEKGVNDILRLVELDTCIKDGVLFPRWFPDLYGGRGGLIFQFYAPLSYFVAEVFHLIGFDYANSIKTVFVMSFVLSAVFMYLFARRFVSESPAFIASVLYVYAPYHLGDTYIRGDLAESLSFVLFPLILLTFHNLIQKKSDKYVIIGGILYASLILTHNIMALIFTAFLVAYLTYFIFEGTLPLKKVVFVLLIGISLSAFFWIPALVEKQYVHMYRIYSIHDYRVSFVPISWLVPSVYLLTTRSIENPYVMLQFGIVGIFLSMGAVLFARSRYVSFIFFLLVVTTFFMTPYSEFFWENLPLIKYIQFPWRLFGIAAILTSILGAIFFEKLTNRVPDTKKIVISLLISLVIVSASLNFIGPDGYIVIDKGISRDMIRTTQTNYAGLTYANEFIPLDAVFPNSTIKTKVSVVSGYADFTVTEEKCSSLSFNTDAKEASILRINTFYFPGWTAYVDGKKEEVRVDSEGLMELDIEKGVHEIKVEFENTWVRTIATLISIISLAFLIILIIYALNLQKVFR